ncbi:asparagine synthase-related protein [Sphingobacterium mizutaii]|uniref:asparagine synthase-related protein n=1 Tax=Sphingobacterium mizutaii TaxID=1010 RepID=UPI002896B7B0|nr:asparagine synthase-related protein [Sphingobacterium mizutaii]
MVDFKYYNHLGFHNPYYHDFYGDFMIESDFERILAKSEHPKKIDFSSLVEVLSTGFCFGDRTLVQGINKTPWMAKPNIELNGWEYFSVPNHSEKILPKGEIVNTFYSLLEHELIDYISPYKKIGILLTGGMDSRIVACVLNNLLNEGRLKEKEIFAFTWGHELSRDVIYSKRIADLFNWNWTHLEVDEDQMHNNCILSVKNGCEYTPIHLHAMSKVSNQKGIDCVLAGSFGDSVGRAEFSGRKVTNLTNLAMKISNVGGVLRDDFYELSKKDIAEDLNKYHTLFPQNKEYQLFEQDQQLHYMRRMLNTCMNVINQKIPLFQMFSSPEVFGFMWSLHPKLRDNTIYFELLSKYSPELLNIPWARTGRVYNSNNGIPDSYRKSHHDYGQMIRDHFLDEIIKSLQQNKLEAKYLFDEKAIFRLINNIRRFPIKGGILFEDRLLYISQVLKLISNNNIEIDIPKNKISFFSLVKKDLSYKGKYIYKKIKK